MSSQRVAPIAWLSLLLLSGSAVAQSKIEERVVAPPWKPGTLLTLSTKGMHFASTHQRPDGKWVVMIDGVESAPYDQVLSTVPTFETTYYDTGFIMSQSINNRGPVAFSPDGTRYAYAARMGEEVVVMLDGKELFRAKDSQTAPPVSLMQFTPDGKRLYFYSASGDTMQSFRLLMDGKPVTPPFDQTPQPVFSADGSRWLLSAGKAKQPSEKFLIIDGKDAGYTGERAVFSPDGKKVISASVGQGKQQLLVDGKSIIEGFAIERFRVGGNGDIAALVQTSATNRNKQLAINGKLIAGTEGANGVTLSPDGKHWAANGMSGLGLAYWVVLDGKKHKDYKELNSITFSPDSSVCLYYGRDDAGWHAVVNGVESEAYGVVRGSTFARTGNKFAYAAGPMPNSMRVYYDGKASPLHGVIFDLALSPDGDHCAYYATTGPTTSEFIVDGEIKGFGGAFGGMLFYSADSKHLAAQARRTNDYDTIYIDGTFIPPRMAPGVPKEFTPDSQHLISNVSAMDTNQMAVFNYFVDGEQVAQFSSRGMNWVNSPKMIRTGRAAMPFGVNSKPVDPDAKDWEVQPDGSIIFIGCAPGPQGYGPIKKVKVTPAATFATWVAGIPAAEAKAAAEAAAIKAKAAEDAALAKQKAADAAAEVAAKRKADYDAAVAAKNKARQEAMDAKRLQVLNAQRAKQKLPPLAELPE